MAKVTLAHVTKTYGNVTAVKDVSIECQDKEFVAILGPSGAGKTSILRMTAGVEPITSGHIFIGDSLVNDTPPGDRDVAMAFENYVLYPHLTVFDNMAYPLRVPRRSRQYSPAEVAERVKKIAKVLGIDDLLDRLPAQLSGGQKQRVSLGRAMVRTPQVFLLDEPIAHLDAKLRHHLRTELKRLSAELNSTILYVTHDYKEALALADKIVILRAGELQQVGTPDEIFCKPANLFVADFVGDPPMNLILADLVSYNDRLYWQVSESRLELPPRTRDSLTRLNLTESRVYIGIRPMHFAAFGVDESVQGILGEVYITEPLGARVLLTVKVSDNLFRVIVPPDFEARIGEQVRLVPDALNIHVFDSVTGVRIA